MKNQIVLMKWKELKNKSESSNAWCEDNEKEKFNNKEKAFSERENNSRGERR